MGWIACNSQLLLLITIIRMPNLVMGMRDNVERVEDC